MRTGEVPHGEHPSNPNQTTTALDDSAGQSNAEPSNAAQWDARQADAAQADAAQTNAAQTDAWQAIAQLALALSQVTTLDELVDALVLLALPTLSAEGCGVITAADDGGWQLALTTSFGPDLRTHFAYEPHDSPLPACRAARNAETFFLPDPTAAREVHPRMEEVVELTSRERWALLPLTVDRGTVGSLAVSWRSAAVFTPAERQLLQVIAAHVAPTVQRLLRAELEHRAHAVTLSMAAAFQDGVLPPLPHVQGIELAVSYRPARVDAVIGGDWYDVLTRRSGATLILVGDVAGHDQQACATMVHTRALFRGLAWDSNDNPARLLDRLDAVIAALQPGTTATAALVELTPTDNDHNNEGLNNGGPTEGGPANSDIAEGGPPDGEPLTSAGFRLSWASAGHPPPLLRLPDGSVKLLTDGEDPLLGVDWSSPRRQHHHPLPDGAVLVMATDGILETRNRSAATGAHILAATLAATDLDSAEAICRHLVGKTSSDRAQNEAQPSAGTPADDRRGAVGVKAQNTSSALQDDRTLLVIRAHGADVRPALPTDTDAASSTRIVDAADTDSAPMPHREFVSMSATQSGRAPVGEPEKQTDAVTAHVDGRDRGQEDDGHRGSGRGADSGVGGDSAEVMRVISLPPEARSTPIARSIVRSVAITGGCDDGVIDTAELLVSEVVTNAVIHGRSDIRMRASCTPQRLLVEVEDGNDRLPDLLPADPEALSGRGLQLLEAAADVWGAHRAEGSSAFSKVVWFPLGRQQ